MEDAGGATAAFSEAFSEAFAELSAIGGEAAPVAGYHRFALTGVDARLRRWFADRAVAGGLEYEEDPNGNQWAWWVPGGCEGRPGVATGSHLDSVPGGGPFDGPLGVLSGFLAVERLRAAGHTPCRPLAVANFVDEEGARFGVACVGSRLLTGVLEPERARRLTDAAGVSMGEALAGAGIDPAGIGGDEALVARVGAFVELHIEQGRALQDLGAPLGVASAIWPHGRWRLHFLGAADHAGTTLLEDRRDALLPLAATVEAARTVARALGVRATVGKVAVVPNGVNAVAATADAWLDCRAPDEATLRAAVARIVGAARTSGEAHGVAVSGAEESFTPGVEFDRPLAERVARLLGGAPLLATAAGHDAGILSAVWPAAMLFVRNPTGVSHSPHEWASAEDCCAGVAALAGVLGDLSGR